MIFNTSLTFATKDVSNHEVVFKKENWELLSYSKIPANTVTFNNGEMNIAVNSSASPIIYPLKSFKKYNKMRIRAQVTGTIKFEKGKQGKKGSDDFRLRVGLVYQGKETLGFFKRKFAAAWIIKLFELAPKDAGVSRIEFYNTFLDDNLKGTKRDHPLSDILKENFSLVVNDKGEINQVIDVPTDSNILALWISCDGDDLSAKYTVKLKEISLLDNK
jgi:hypothetical protein